MWKWICKQLLNLLGFKGFNGIMPDKKAIIIGVPHTSGWDFIVSYLHYASLGATASTVIKKEFFFWPLGYIIKKLGGIPIDRSKSLSVVKQIINEFNSRETLHLAITPEGTRKLTKNWKAGFHTIAKATGASVYLGVFDFGKKQVGWYEKFELTDDAQADIKRMKAFYREKGLVGKHPELFTAED